MVADYFSLATFREHEGDNTSPHRYSESDMLRGQAETIDCFERWGHTSFSTRTDRIEVQRRNAPLVLTRCLPVVAVTEILIDGVALDLARDDLDIGLATGIIRWGTWDWGYTTPRLIDGWGRGFAQLQLTYDYGYGYAMADMPEGIVTPLCDAAASRLDGEEGRGKIPRNTQRYSAERTDITMGRRGAVRPFPWDQRASDDVRAYWDTFRPRSIISTVT